MKNSADRLIFSHLRLCRRHSSPAEHELRLLLLPTFRIFGCAEDTSARQNASELAFALAYPYL